MPGQIGNGVVSECQGPLSLSLATWQGSDTSLPEDSPVTQGSQIWERPQPQATSPRQEDDVACRPVGEDSW